MIAPIASLAVLSFLLAWLVTFSMRRVAPRLGFVDRPGHRKIHPNPIALGGGVALFVAVALPLAAVIIGAWAIDSAHPPRMLAGLSRDFSAYVGGVRQQTPLAAGLIAAMLAMHLLGLWDDRRALGPYLKLAIQVAVITALVIRFRSLWSLTAVDEGLHAGHVLSIGISVLWITAITNAFNFLDNMDGLSAGIAAVCTTAFLVTALSIEQWFVAAALALLLGALLGFLCFNFAPASIFMGDSGSLLVGLLLGVLTIRTTYLTPGTSLGAGWYSVFAPLIVLAVPLYDLVVVSAIRILRGHSPFKGDTNHFSHRLVARGMSRRTAVLCLYLITAATSIAAIILPHAPSTFVALLIFAQTLLVLGVVALLEQHPLPAATSLARTEEVASPPLPTAQPEAAPMARST